MQCFQVLKTENNSLTFFNKKGFLSQELFINQMQRKKLIISIFCKIFKYLDVNNKKNCAVYNFEKSRDPLSLRSSIF